MGKMIFESTKQHREPTKAQPAAMKIKDNRYLKEARKYKRLLYVSGIINIILLLTTLLRK